MSTTQNNPKHSESSSHPSARPRPQYDQPVRQDTVNTVPTTSLPSLSSDLPTSSLSESSSFSHHVYFTVNTSPLQHMIKHMLQVREQNFRGSLLTPIFVPILHSHVRGVALPVAHKTLLPNLLKEKENRRLKTIL